LIINLADLRSKINHIGLKNGSTIVHTNPSGNSIIAVMNNHKLSKIFMVDKNGKHVPTIIRRVGGNPSRFGRIRTAAGGRSGIRIADPVVVRYCEICTVTITKSGKKEISNCHAVPCT